jgi:primosomal protein N' (replication factor Y) (superfamily II helicase)
VALFSPPHATLTYLCPPHLEDLVAPGCRVLIPLGTSGAARLGMLLKPSETTSEYQLKSLLWPVDREPLLDAAYLEMAAQLALRQASTPGRVLGSLLPAGIRSARIRFVLIRDGKQQTLRPAQLKGLAEEESIALAKAWREGTMELRENSPSRDGVCWQVTGDPPWPVRPAARRQLELLDHLWEKGGADRTGLVRDLGAEAARTLAVLAERGLVTSGPPPEAETGGEATASPCGEEGCPYELTEDQNRAVEALLPALDGKKGRTELLWGVTGSGKSAVYLELAKACLERGRSALLLAPEVALARHLLTRARARFPELPIVFHHGYLPIATREKAFRELTRSGEAALVIGTRSALFLPGPAPGLIVLDEEHDASFKQEERLAYQAKEVAHFRVGQKGGLLLLGSATPDVKTFHASREERITAVTLPHRLGRREMPKVRLVDLRLQPSHEELPAPETMERLQETVSRGEQAIILLNRRGYAPLMYCLECGQVTRCPHCDIGLTFHKARERLLCHYCGLSEPYPKPCALCGCTRFLPMGQGTEKLAEALSRELPHEAKVLRLDRDTTRRPGRMEEILTEFEQGKAQVLVGTQMLSKGHHFPEVTLVVAADADMGLHLPDYRATERTFQLLTQAAGRAGRGDRPGEVYIQTRDPEHFCWGFVRDNDYEGFYAREIESRQTRRYPPFVKLALVRLSYPLQWEAGSRAVADAARAAREAGKKWNAVVLGPAPAPLAMLRGRKRFQCLLKAQDWPSLRSVYTHIQAALPASSQLRLSLDLDPSNLL